MAKVMIGVHPHKLSAPSRSSTSPRRCWQPHARHEQGQPRSDAPARSVLPGAGGRSGAAAARAGAAAAGRRRTCSSAQLLGDCLDAEANPLLRIADSPFHCRGAGRAKWRVRRHREVGPTWHESSGHTTALVGSL